ncbi:SU10 major capsid protein [Paenibacillus sp. FSL K6-2859]|uniref:SU10 major capsid protein n=1 Tax=Paenibacillus sp. FSL K6-2859 TaxID=2921482 RepID=UPI0030F5AEB5
MLKSYDFQDQVRQLEAGISLIIEDSPTLLGLIGLGTTPLYQTKYEWMSDNLNSNRAVAAEAALIGANTITVAAGDGLKFRVNAIVVIGEEYLRVTAVAGDVITVVRGYDGTTASAVALGAEIRIVSRPQLEGALPGVDEGHDRLVDYNYAQIIERYAAVSGTQQNVRTYNVTNELDYQVQLRLKEIAREQNDWLIYGRRIDAGAGTPRTTGGLLYFADKKGAAKENAAGGEITPKLLNDLAEKMYLRGGSANTILTNTAGARQITKFASDTIRTERTDTATGHKIQTFVSDIVGGSVATVIVDPNFPKNKIALFDRDILSIDPLNGRGLFDTDATVPGADFVARQIRGEYGVTVKNAGEKIAILENISTKVS